MTTNVALLPEKWRKENGDYPESKRDCADELAAALAHRQDGELLASLLSRPSRVWRSESETGTEELARGIVIDPIELRTLAASPRGVDEAETVR